MSDEIDVTLIIGRQRRIVRVIGHSLIDPAVRRGIGHIVRVPVFSGRVDILNVSKMLGSISGDNQDGALVNVDAPVGAGPHADIGIAGANQFYGTPTAVAFGAREFAPCWSLAKSTQS